MATRGIRPIRIEGNVAYVPLTQGYEAVIDAADVTLVDGFNWFAHVFRRRDRSIRAIYAERRGPHSGGQTTIIMHRVIDATPSGMETDHIDGDGLNNRRSNLRAATKAQNQHNAKTRVDNKSGAKGVHWDKRNRKWRVQIAVMAKNKHIGLFTTFADAQEAYAKAIAATRGEFGRLS